MVVVKRQATKSKGVADRPKHLAAGDGVFKERSDHT